MSEQKLKEIREKILEKENYVCYICGKKATTTHMPFELRKYNSYYKYLIAVCDECHKKLHRIISKNTV